MKSPVIAALTLSLVLAGCGSVRESRLNPFNWFGGSEEGTATLTPKQGYGTDPNDFRIPVATVTRFEIAPAHGGAILTAVGLPPTQGWWDTELVAENDGQPVDGVLSFRFLIAEPLRGTAAARRVSTPQSREVTAATFLSNQKLAGVTQIVVTGTGNSRSVRR